MKKLFVIGFMSASFPLWGTLFPVSPDTSQAAAKKKYLQVDDAAEGTVYAYEFPAVVPQVRVKVPGSSSWEVPYSPCYGNSLGNVEGGVNRWGDTLLVIYRNEETEEYEFRYFDLLGNPLSPAYSLGQAERVWGFRHNLYPSKGVILYVLGDSLYLSQVTKTGILKTHSLVHVTWSPQSMDVSSVEQDTLFPFYQRVTVSWIEDYQLKVQNFTYFVPISPVITVSPDSLPPLSPVELKSLPNGVGVLWLTSSAYGFCGRAVYRGLSWSGNALGEPLILPEVFYGNGFLFLMDYLIEGSPLNPDWIVLMAAYHIWVDPEPSCIWGIPGLYVYDGTGQFTYLFDFYHHTCYQYASMTLDWVSPDTFRLSYITPTDELDVQNHLVVKVFPLGEDWVSSVELDDEIGTNQSSPLLSLPEDGKCWVLWDDGGRYKIRAFDQDGDPHTPEIDDGQVLYGYMDWTFRAISATVGGLAVGWYTKWSGFPSGSNQAGLRTFNLDGDETSDHLLCISNDVYCSVPLLSSSDTLIAVALQKDTSYMRIFDVDGNLLIASDIPFLPNGIIVLDDGNILTVSTENDSLALRVMTPQGEWITDYLKLIPIGYSYLRTSRVEDGKYLVAVKIGSDYTHGDIMGFYYYWPEDTFELAFSIPNTEWSFATSWDAAAGPGSRVLVVWVKEREGPCGTTKDIWIYRKNIPNQSEGWLFDEPAFERRRPQVEVGDSTLWIAWQERKLGTMNSDVYVMVENMPPVNVKGPVSITGVQKFRVLGSPTTGTLALTVPPLPKGSRIEVFDIAGRRVFQHPVGLTDGGKVYLSLKLPSGNYFVLLKNGKETLLGPLPFTVLR